MIKINSSKKKAQHVVELAIIAPLFILLFSAAFQIMVETYTKYKFSYEFNNAIRNVLDDNDLFNNENFNIADEIKDNFNGEINVALLDTNRLTAFLLGTFEYNNVGITGNSLNPYFFSMIPINRSYLFPNIYVNDNPNQNHDFSNFADFTNNRIIGATSVNQIINRP